MDDRAKRRLALRWAPIHYQAINKDNAKADFITRIDYAGTWKTSGNWDALDAGHSLTGAAYYSVAETESHWYILYVFYHARDWDLYDQHENDLEGFLTIVQRPNNRYLQKHFPDGIFLGIITCAHVDFYGNSNVLRENREGWDGKIKFEKGPDQKPHPCTFQEMQGHGCKSYKGYRNPYVRYAPTDDNTQLAQPENITPRDGIITRHVFYELIDMHESNGFWQRRWSAPVNEPFTVSGRLRGGKKGKDSANPPWRWDDHNDGPDLGLGILAYNPAYIAWEYFSGFMYDDLAKFYRYTDMPFKIPIAMLYGQAADDALLNRYLNSTNKFEKLCAAGQFLLAGNTGSDIANIMANSLLDSELSMETLWLIENYVQEGSPLAANLAQLIVTKLTNQLTQIKVDRVPGMIRALQLLRTDSGKNIAVELYIKNKNDHVKAAAAKYLARLPVIAYPQLHQTIKKNLNRPMEDFVREASARLYLQWDLINNPDPLFHLVDDEYSNVQLVVADSCRKLESIEPITTMDILTQLIGNKKWDVRVLAAITIAKSFDDHGLEVIAQTLKNEYDYSRKLIDDNNYDLTKDYSDCPGNEKDYGRLYLSTYLAELGDRRVGRNS